MCGLNAINYYLQGKDKIEMDEMDDELIVKDNFRSIEIVQLC